MKRIVFFITLFLTVAVNAQTQLQFFKIDRYIDNAGNNYSMGIVGDSMLFVHLCTIQEYDALYLTLDKKETLDFLRFLKKCEKIIEKQTKKQQNQKIKMLPLHFYHGAFFADFKYTSLLGKSYYVSGYYIDNFKTAPSWFIENNNEGKSYLSFDCLMSDNNQKIKNLLNDDIFQKCQNKIGTIHKNKQVLCVKEVNMDIEHIKWLQKIIENLSVKLENK